MNRVSSTLSLLLILLIRHWSLLSITIILHIIDDLRQKTFETLLLNECSNVCHICWTNVNVWIPCRRVVPSFLWRSCLLGQLIPVLRRFRKPLPVSCFFIALTVAIDVPSFTRLRLVGAHPQKQVHYHLATLCLFQYWNANEQQADSHFYEFFTKFSINPGSQQDCRWSKQRFRCSSQWRLLPRWHRIWYLWLESIHCLLLGLPRCRPRSFISAILLWLVLSACWFKSKWAKRQWWIL